MNKRAIRKVEIEEAVSNDITLARKSKKKIHLLKANICEIENEKILVISIYKISDLKNGIVVPFMRTFQTKEDYITQDLTSEKVKWKTGSLYNLLNIDWWKSTWDSIVLTREAEEAICEYLYIQENPINELRSLQEKIMRNRLEKKHKKITDPIDEKMKSVPELPKDFKKWISETVFYDKKYIFYEYKNRKNQNGYCTNCGKDVIINNQRHNRDGICPNCGIKIRYKAIKKAKYVRDYAYATIIQPIENGFVLREFSVDKIYDDHYRTPGVTYYEEKRRFYESNEFKNYEWAEFKQSGKVRWCDDEDKKHMGRQALYTNNLEFLKDTKWKYAAIKELAESTPGFKFEVYDYLVTYEKHPILEYLVKLKLFKLARDSVEGNIIGNYDYRTIRDDKKKFNEIMGINKSKLQLLQKLNVSSTELQLLQEAEKRNINLTEKQIRYISEENVCYYSNILFDLTQYASVQKILKYLENQTGKGIADTYILSDWRDYIEICKKLKFNLKDDFVLFPKNLKEEHDKVERLLEIKKNKKADRAIKKMYKELMILYGWENNKYQIVAPKNAEEIITEGQNLHHCVKTYLERVQKKQTTILFLREKEDPEKSFYTIEVREGKLIQCRGLHNKSYTEDKDIKKAINKFEKDKLQKLKQVG